MTPSEFKLRVANAPHLDFGQIFNQSLQLFAKSWLYGLVLQLIILVVFFPFVFVIYGSLFAGIFTNDFFQETDFQMWEGYFAGLSLLYGILIFVGFLILLTVQFSISMAFIRMLRQLDLGQPVQVSDLFYFLKTRYLGKILGLMLITIAICIPAALLCYLPLIFVLIPICFFSIIFAFNPEWSVPDIVAGGFQLGIKKWFFTFAMLFVCYALVSIASFVTCGLATLFLTAYLYHPLYLIYAKVMGVVPQNEIDQIGQSL